MIAQSSKVSWEVSRSENNRNRAPSGTNVIRADNRAGHRGKHGHGVTCPQPRMKEGSTHNHPGQKNKDAGKRDEFGSHIARLQMEDKNPWATELFYLNINDVLGLAEQNRV